jgi:hypothetical protein
MPDLPAPAPYLETELVSLAREIAMNQWPLQEILNRYGVSAERWQDIANTPLFRQYLDQQITEWNSVANTNERVKFKSAALLEFWLEEAHTKLHDDRQQLAPKVELAKFIGRLAGMGITGAEINAGGGNKVSVTINLGADTQLKFEKELPQKVIEHEPAE